VRLDTWAATYFPARLALWALVTTISRDPGRHSLSVERVEPLLLEELDRVRAIVVRVTM